MWAVYILLALFLILLLLLLMPVILRISFDGGLHILVWLLLPFRLDATADEEVSVSVRVLGAPLWSFPSEEEEDVADSDKIAKSKKRAAGKIQELTAELKSGNLLSTLTFIKDFVRLIGDESGRLFRRMVVDRLWLQARVATGDAAETAQLYGTLCSVLYPLLTRWSQVAKIRRRDVRIEPDFLSENGAVRFDLRFRLSVFTLLTTVLAVVRGIDSLNETDR